MLWRGSSRPQGFLPPSVDLQLDIQGTFQRPQPEEQTPECSGSRFHQDLSEKSRQVNCFLFIPISQKDFKRLKRKVQDWRLDCVESVGKDSMISFCQSND